LEPETLERSPALKTIERICFAAGLLLLAWLLYRIGPATLVSNLALLGWGFLLVVALHVLVVFFNGLSWKLLLPPDRRVSLVTLGTMIVVGDGINAVSPVGFIGGELMRANLLRRYVPGPEAVSSVALAAMSQFVGQAVFLLTGLPLAIGRVGNESLRVVFLILSGALLALLAFVLWIGWSRRAFAWAGKSLDRVRWLRERWQKLPERWRSLGAQTVDALRRRPGSFAGSVAAALAAWQVGVVETYLILRLVRQPVALTAAFAIEVLAVAIEGAFFFVPAKIGTQEGGKVLIFLAMGLSPAKGLALGFVRRLRALAWAAIGFVALGLYPWRGGRASASLVAR